jgi:hypothetical protein
MSTTILPIYPIYDLDKLGAALIIMAVIYFLIFLTAIYKIRRIFRFITEWGSQKLFHVCILLTLFVRTASFSTLSIFYFQSPNKDPWYPLVVMLFTLPEFLAITMYIMVVFTWLEIYVFSHEQFLIQSLSKFREQWKCSFYILSIILYAVLAAFYVLLCVKPDTDLQDVVVTEINLCIIISNFCAPAIACMVRTYFGVCVLSGFSFASALAEQRAKKVNDLFVVWTISRFARGVIMFLSSDSPWEKNLSSPVLVSITVATLLLCEIFPCLMSTDWGIMGVLLLGDDLQHRLVVRSTVDDHHAASGQEDEHMSALTDVTDFTQWELPMSAIKLQDAPHADPASDPYQGVCFTRQGMITTKLP